MSVQGPARQWLPFERNVNLRVAEAYRRARETNATDGDYATCYRLARGLLMSRGGFRDENPGEYVMSEEVGVIVPHREFV